jgi:hypothetical protein
VGDGRLGRDREHNLLERLHIAHLVNEREKHVESRLQNAVKAAKALYNPRLLLWHKLDDLVQYRERDRERERHGV